MARTRSNDPAPSISTPAADPQAAVSARPGRRSRSDMAPKPPVNAPRTDDEVNVAIAASADSAGGTITARRAGGLRDVGMSVDAREVGLPAALQHLAKGVNIAFQTDYGENFLEAVYQAAIVFDDEILIVHKEYFGFGQSWFSQFGKLLRSMQLTLDGPDPASPEGQRRLQTQGPATIRGILNLFGRKLDLVAEYEDRVPAYVEQMFDRLEASGIIDGWHREDWRIRTTRVGLDIRISPAERVLDELKAREQAAAKAQRAALDQQDDQDDPPSEDRPRKGTSPKKKAGRSTTSGRKRPIAKSKKDQ